jgi:hypothetical protein
MRTPIHFRRAATLKYLARFAKAADLLGQGVWDAAIQR